MPLPKERFMELPLLHEIQQRGGTVRPDAALFNSVAGHFPMISQTDLDLKNMSGGQSKWTNRVWFVRKDLVVKGEIDRSVHGVWSITQKGRDRLAREWPSWSAQNAEYSTRLYTDKPRSKRGKTGGPPKPEGENSGPGASPPVQPPGPPILQPAVGEQLRQRLESLSPRQFEVFVGKYLERKGLKEVQITGQSHDGGLDGNAIEPFLRIKVAFQAKKWAQGQTVGAGPIRELLGSITNRGADRGVFITTAAFSPGGKEEAELSQGRIILIDGQHLASDCVDMQLGVKARVVQADLDKGFFERM